MASTSRSYIAGKFALEIDGVSAGYVKSFEGGGISADVISEPAGTAFVAKKHIGQPKYEDLAVRFGFNMTAAVFDWIANTLTGAYSRKDGRVIATDYNLVPESTREFFNAIITEITIPAMDAASKDAAYLTLKFAPEYTRYKKATGKPTANAGKTEQKLFLPSNFRLEIDGLDCTKVIKIDAFSVKQSVVTDDIGELRDYQREAGKLEFPNLKISLPEGSAQTWLDWFDDFVVKGNCAEKNEKSGALVLLAPDRKNELARISFFNLGIFRLAPDKAEANTDAIKRITAELYCERMELKVVGKGAGPDGAVTLEAAPQRKTAAAKGAKG